ncbi:hypothetical protein IJJ12_01845, partial [bacterium]|nr:hypothetical protein [bacterium]
RFFLGLQMAAPSVQPVIRSVDDLLPTSVATFEGHEFYVPAHPEKILFEQYGDWYEFPHANHIHMDWSQIDKHDFALLKEILHE